MAIDDRLGNDDSYNSMESRRVHRLSQKEERSLKKEVRKKKWRAIKSVFKERARLASDVSSMQPSSFHDALLPRKKQRSKKPKTRYVYKRVKVKTKKRRRK